MISSEKSFWVVDRITFLAVEEMNWMIDNWLTAGLNKFVVIYTLVVDQK